MPFQSEKQRRYLWANEPEIARDWTDTYGSGIAKALGGRIGFWNGSGNIRQQPHQPRDLLVQNNPYGTRPRYQPPGGGATSMGSGRDVGGGGRSHDRGGRQHQATATRQVAATRARDRHPTTESTGREQAIANRTYSRPDQLPITRGGQHIGTGPLTQSYDKNLRTLALQNQYRQGAYQRAHPFLSKVRSGLGSLGRGIGHVARNFNPLSFAFENPLMKLLMSGYGRGNMRNIFQRNNQNINWNDPDEEEDVAWENVNYNPNALTRLEQLGIMSPNILPEDKPYESYFDDRNLMADVSQPDIDILTGMGGITHESDPADIRQRIEWQGNELNPTMTDQEIIDVLKKKITSPTGKFA